MNIMPKKSLVIDDITYIKDGYYCLPEKEGTPSQKVRCASRFTDDLPNEVKTTELQTIINRNKDIMQFLSELDTLETQLVEKLSLYYKTKASPLTVTPYGQGRLCKNLEDAEKILVMIMTMQGLIYKQLEEYL